MPENQMGTKPIKKLLWTMAIPPMVSMLIQSLYNVIDSIFVARLGEEALAALSLAFPLQSLTLAFAVGIGIALNALISRALGQKDYKLANKYVSHGLTLSLIHSAIFILVGIFITPIYFSYFTNDPTILDYAITYGGIVTTFAFGQIFHISIEKLFQATGDMMTPMYLLLAGALTNIILDPILIFGINGYLEFGVMGAAMATIIGQLVAGILAFYIFKKKSTVLAPKISFKLSMSTVRQLYAIAIPSGLVLAIPSVVVSMLNSLLASFSTSAVAFYGVYYKIQSFIYMPASGVIQGMRPLIGYNFGAKKLERVHHVIRLGFISVSLILFTGSLFFFLFPSEILSLFNASNQMLSIGQDALRILSVAILLSTVGYISTGIFESFGRGDYSLYVTLLRQLLITLPFAYIFAPSLGVHAVWFGYLLGEIIGSIIGIILYKKLPIN